MAQAYVGHRSGQTNATGNARSLFLKLYAGEVMTAFQTKNIMMDYCRVRTIKNGKSAQFIMTGKNRAASYHTPGNEIVPDVGAKHTERLVTIDDLLVAHQFIPNIDEAMQHFDIRSVYTDEASYGLAKVADKNILRMAIKAALSTTKTKATALVQDYAAWDDEDFTANVEYAAAIGNSMKADYFLEGIIEAKRILEMAGAPLDGLVCVLATDVYYGLFKTAGVSKETGLHMFDKDIGGGASVTDVSIPSIAGIPVVRTPHLGTGTTTAWTNSLWTSGGTGANLTGTTNDAVPIAGESARNAVYDLPATYMNDAQKVRGIVMHKDAVATVKLLDLSVESEYQINRQGTLLVAKYAMGHNVLRPAMAVALTSPVAA